MRRDGVRQGKKIRGTCVVVMAWQCAGMAARALGVRAKIRNDAGAVERQLFARHAATCRNKQQHIKHARLQASQRCCSPNFIMV